MNQQTFYRKFYQHHFLKWGYFSTALTLLFLLYCSFSFGQQVPCNTFTYEQQLLNDNEYAQRKGQIENAISEKRKTDQMESQTEDLLTIPIVVHIVHAPGESIGQGSNISDQAITDAIEFLNNEFQGAVNQLTFEKEDMNISFCHAGTTRFGSSEFTDLDRLVEDNPNNQSGSIKSTMYSTFNEWPRTDFLNVWVVTSICAGSNCLVEGYSTLAPAHGSWFDGVVIEYDALGGFPFVHEVGHYLNLYHTFGLSDDYTDCTNNDCNLDNDKVCDTRPDGTAMFTCDVTNVCNTDALSGPFNNDDYDPVGNIMDYSDCYEYFTVGQKERMRSAIINVRGSLLNNAGACCMMPEGPMYASFSYTLNSSNTEITVNAQESTSGTAFITNYEWNINGTIHNSTTIGNQTYPLPPENVISVCLTISSNIPGCFDTECTSICLGTGDGCNYICNSDLESPENSFFTAGFFYGKVPGWVCETPSPDYSNIGLPGTPDNTGSAHMIMAGGNAYEAVRALTGELPSNKKYIFSMYKWIEEGEIGTKTRVLIDKNNSIVPYPCVFPGGQGFIISIGDALQIFEDEEFESNTNFTRYIVCFEIPGNGIGYHDVVIYPYESQGTGKLRVTRVELLEDSFLKESEITITCPGEVSLGMELSCTLTDVFYKWEKETSPGNYELVVENLTSPVYSVFVNETTKFRLTRIFKDVYGNEVMPQCSNVLLQSEITVTVNGQNPNPGFTFIAQDCSTLVQFASNDTDPGTTHSWIFNDPNNTNCNPCTSNSPNPAFDFSCVGSFEVTHIVENGCGTLVFTKTIELACDYPCECPPGSLLLGQDGETTSLTNDYPNTGPVITGCVEIAGRLIVDNNIKFNQANVIMHPCSEIVLEKKQMEVVASDFYSCDQMWKGIVVNPGSYLFSNYSSYKDAHFAIKAIGTPTNTTGPISFVGVQNSTFDRDFIGVYAPGGFGVPHNVQMRLRSNTFECTENLLPSCNLVATPVGLPDVGSHTYAGIWTQELVQITVGDNTNIFPPSNFRGIANGVYAERTNLNVYNSIFEKINSTYGYPQGFITMRGIYANGFQSGSFTLEQRGLGGEQNSTPSFSNVEIGIEVLGMNLNTAQNRMTGVRTGIIASNCRMRNIGIKDNFIRAGSFGIQLFQNDHQSTQLLVSGNDIEVGFGGLFSFNKAGIRIEEAGIPHNNNSAISGNRIFTFNANAGISAQSSNNLKFTGNQIRLENQGAFGIRLDGSPGAKLGFNEIDGIGNIPSGYLNYGISVFNSMNVKYCCNDVDNTAVGIRLWGGCNSQDNFRHNFITNHNTGLRFETGTILGTQSHMANEWLETSYSNFGALHQQPILALESQFNVDNTFPDGMPSFFTTANVSNWFFLQEDPDDVYPTCNDDCGFPPNIVTLGTIDDFEEKLLSEDPVIFEFPKVVRWLAERNLYQKLQEDPELIGNDATLSGFISEVENSNTGIFQSIEHGKKEMYAMPSTLDGAYASNQNDINTYLNQIKVLDEAILTATEPGSLESEKNALLAQLGNALIENTNLSNVIYAGIEDQADEFLLDNENISPVEIYEINERKVNHIFLKTIPAGQLTFDSADLTTLETIANQCPLEGGNAVFQARSLLALVNDTLVFNDLDLCRSGYSTGRNNDSMESTVNTTDSYYRFLPNPASGSVTFAFSGRPQYLVLFDLRGTILASYTLPEVGQQYTFDVSNLGEGMYLCKIIEDKKTAFTDKLIIIR